MTSTTKSLEDLKSIVSEQPVDADAVEASADSQPREYVRVVDDKGRSYATGKRKNAVARIWLKPGKGKIEVNGRPIEKYFARPALQMVIDHAFKVVGREKSYDVVATAIGGGLSGQAGAVRHGISKALVLQEPELRTPLKAAGLITRDSRVVERKKYGRRKARRSFQFSKR